MSGRIIIDELEFELPYGKLAAKTWHEETEESKRILAIHGWMDNAGSFDKIMPRIKHKDGLYIVALDLPGHGKSSQLPAGSSYSDLILVMEIRRCLMELDWVQPLPKRSKENGTEVGGGGGAKILDDEVDGPLEPRKKFTIIGHSLGGALSLLYASLYPNDVDEVIVLDFIKAKSPPAEVLMRNTARCIDNFIETVPSQMASSINSKEKSADKGQVIVSYEAAIVATIDAHKRLGILSREDAKCLLKRSTVAVNSPPNCVIYSRDLRLQSMLNFRESLEVHKVMFSRVSCNVILILGKQGLYGENEYFRDRMDEMEAYYKERAKTFYLQWIEGDHYLHMNQPELVAKIINNYLEAPEIYRVTSQSD